MASPILYEWSARGCIQWTWLFYAICMLSVLFACLSAIKRQELFEVLHALLNLVDLVKVTQCHAVIYLLAALLNILDASDPSMFDRPLPPPPNKVTAPCWPANLCGCAKTVCSESLALP